MSDAFQRFRRWTTEPGQRPWPRPLSARGSALLAMGLVSVGRGLVYLNLEIRPDLLVFVDDAVGRSGYASMWLVAGALTIVLGPTRAWRYGLAASVGMNFMWAGSYALSSALLYTVPPAWTTIMSYSLIGFLGIALSRMKNPDQDGEVRS